MDSKDIVSITSTSIYLSAISIILLATMAISTLFVAVNLSELRIVISSAKKMKKLKMSKEIEIATMSNSKLFVAVNLS